MPSAEALGAPLRWECAACDPGGVPEGWFAATVPGTAAGALRDAARPEPDDLDAQDWWFRTSFAVAAAQAGERLVLVLEGVATRGVVLLDGEPVAEVASMWARHEVDVGERLAGGGTHELAIRCDALGPLLGTPRKPRARWRTKLAAQGLRFHRTMLLGRTPGMAPRPAAVGPWRPVRLERRTGPELAALTLRTHLDGATGVLTAHARWGVDGLPSGVRPPPGAAVEAGGERVGLDAGGRAEVRLADVARWWPHTHGEPVLHEVRLVVGDDVVATRRVGFRQLAAGAAADHDVDRDGLDLHVNGRRVFARGAVWTPVDPVGLAPPRHAVRATLSALRDAGLNLVRVVGTAHYESPAFHDLCDELGMLVWQDAMFANFDYPLADPAFRAEVERELAQLVADVGGRPSTAVLCGGSEVAQQVAMLGLDPDALLAGGVGDALLPAAVAAGGCDAIVVPDAPSGAHGRVLRADAGVANWFGVGGYRRPLDDARRASVRFASECLALSNVPDEAMVDRAGWDAGVPRDAGAAWDFADVRDHYLQQCYGLDPAELRRTDLRRYLELSRAVGGEVMAAVFGEWRRAASPCGGGIVLWARDLHPGAGWGLLDADGRPKAVLHHLRRALAPTAVWMTDEGLGGLAVHVANDGPRALRAQLRVALHRNFAELVDEAVTDVDVAPGETVALDAERVLGRWADVSYAYRFGPPAHDAVVVGLERDGAVLGQAFAFPAGPPLAPRTPEELGASATAEPLPGGAARLRVRSRAGLWGVRIHADGFRPADDAFSVAPGGHRDVELAPERPDVDLGRPSLSALNLIGRIPAVTG